MSLGEQDVTSKENIKKRNNAKFLLTTLFFLQHLGVGYAQCSDKNKIIPELSLVQDMALPAKLFAH